MSCPPDFTMDYSYDVAPFWFSTFDPQTNSSPPKRPADPNANLQGTATGSWSGYNLTWTWNLAPVR